MSILLKLLALLIGACLFCHASDMVSGSQGGKIPIFPVPRPANHASLILSNVSISNSHNFAYLALTSIGGQNLFVLLDTGSSDLWVVSSGCKQDDCQGVPAYSPSSSLSLTQSHFQLDYLLGSVKGEVGTETVTLGPFEITPQVFALANETTGLGLTGTGNSGILGLSFPLEAAIPETSGRPLLDNLLSPFNDPERYFAFKLGRDQSSSSFTVGQIDTDFANSTSDFTFTSVIPAYASTYDYWKLPIQRITINGTNFELSKTGVDGSHVPIAVLDTGTTLILGPTSDVDRFWQSVGGAVKHDDLWQVRCDRAIIVGFVLGDSDSAKEYVLNPSDVSWEEGGRRGDYCLGGIQGNDEVSSGDWLLGDSFLRNVYTIHHAATSNQPPKIGLLGMTDPVSALAQYRLERGEDPTPSVAVIATPNSQHSGLNAAAVCGISGASGFVFGFVVSVALLFRRWARS
ncbi:hypothetical protein NLI96_g6392 [Meripilus lineatus]|uniref:Peptidase A1 domain-containing protein n=1 Tax=Meripilus lineatus TaxID=2056292 RepID=A0AAD5V6C5_9APHY|nr:hypothetical protein NLI96_g6392 [Physisporinus lineatus]